MVVLFHLSDKMDIIVSLRIRKNRSNPSSDYIPNAQLSKAQQLDIFISSQQFLYLYFLTLLDSIAQFYASVNCFYVLYLLFLPGLLRCESTHTGFLSRSCSHFSSIPLQRAKGIKHRFACGNSIRYTDRLSSFFSNIELCVVTDNRFHTSAAVLRSV